MLRPGIKSGLGLGRNWVSHLARFGDGISYLAGTEPDLCHFGRKARDKMAGVRIKKNISELGIKSI